MDAKEFDMACGPDVPAVSCDYDMSDMSWKHAHFSDKQVVNGLLVSNVDIGVDAAFSMRPVDHPKALSLKVSAGNFAHGNIVINQTDQTWQEERESLLQCSLKSGLVALSYLDATTIIGAQLEFELTELGNSTLLADDFRECIPATLLRRVGSVEKTCSNSGLGRFPPDEPFAHQFFTAERKQDATSSCLKWFLGALSFCMRVLFMDQIGQVVQSHRCLEAVTKDVSLMICQASSLKVDELQMLRTKFFTGKPWGRIFSSAILFAVRSRAGWSDHMYCTEVLLDRDDHKALRFFEGHIASNKIMRAELFKYRFLPLKAPAFGVSSDSGPEQWMASRHSTGVVLTPVHTIMPAPNHKRCLTQRLQLGDHAGGGTGLKMVHTYTGDASSESAEKFVMVHGDIRVGRFLPDSTQSGRFGRRDMTTTDGSAKPMPSGREELSAVVGFNMVNESQRASVVKQLAPAQVTAARRKSFRRDRRSVSFTIHQNHLRVVSFAAFPIKDAASSAP